MMFQKFVNDFTCDQIQWKDGRGADKRRGMAPLVSLNAVIGGKSIFVFLLNLQTTKPPENCFFSFSVAVNIYSREKKCADEVTVTQLVNFLKIARRDGGVRYRTAVGAGTSVASSGATGTSAASSGATDTSAASSGAAIVTPELED